MADDSPAVEERPALEVKIEDAGPACKKLTIEIPEERIKEKIESSFTTLSDDAAIPGFRRGRAPRRLLEKRFGSAVRDDVKGQLLSEAYSQACEENSLDVLGEPDVKDVESIELPESGTMTFEVEVEVTPEVELPDFGKIKVTRTKAEVTDDDLQKQLDQYRERFGKATEVADAKIEEGDFAQADVQVYAGEDAGEDAEVLQDAHDAYILVNGESRDFKGHVAGILIDDLGKQLIGKQPGESLSISMTGPATHENEQIKGQPITVKIDLKKVERLEPADMDTVVQNLGAESEDALKTQLRGYLEQQKQAEQTADMHRQVNDQLAEMVDLELPEGITGRQVERVLARQRYELMYRGTPEAEIEQQLAEARNDSEQEAVRQLKLFFILDAASKQLEIEVNENELNGRIAMMAVQQGRRPEKMRQEMQSRGELEQLYLQLREQKTLDAVIEKADVTEVEAKPDAEAKADKPKKKKSTPKKKAASKKKADEA